MRVEKLDDGLAIRLPAEFVESPGLKAGDEVEVSRSGYYGLLVEKKMTHEEAIETIRRGGIELPVDYKFDREEANARR